MPHRPGVYIFRDRRGQVIYVGRSRNLASRVRSYWGDLGDRPHLSSMVRRVAWLEPVLCASEHEAAFLESDLLERHPTRYNRTLGMESCVWLRLDANPLTPGLDVIHDATPADGARWFGPYLGWEPVRQAAAGLLRLYPLRYSGLGVSRSERELARSLGVVQADRPELVRRIDCVLRRDAAAVRSALRSLTMIRDRASAGFMFEHAESIQQEIRGLTWIAESQRLMAPGAIDGDFSGSASAEGAAVRVVLSLRGGRIWQRHVHRIGAEEVEADSNPTDGRSAEWADSARENAELMARLAAAEAIGPTAWRM